MAAGALIVSHVVLLVLGFAVGSRRRYKAGVLAGQRKTELEHGWDPTDFPRRDRRLLPARRRWAQVDEKPAAPFKSVGYYR